MSLRPSRCRTLCTSSVVGSLSKGWRLDLSAFASEVPPQPRFGASGGVAYPKAKPAFVWEEAGRAA